MNETQQLTLEMMITKHQVMFEQLELLGRLLEMKEAYDLGFDQELTAIESISAELLKELEQNEE